MRTLKIFYKLLLKNTSNALLWATIITVPIYVFALYQALIASPADYLQGESVRIMYVHVPAAWLALGIYIFMAISNSMAIIYKSRFAEITAYAAAPIGLCFTSICLITGSIWGKAVWGTWWVWDARLTSMLILLFLYIGYILLWNNERTFSRSAAVLNIVGAINIPIIKFSVNFWNTLHQPASIIRKGGVAIDNYMLLSLLAMFAASIGISIIIYTLRLKTLIYTIKKAQKHE